MKTERWNEGNDDDEVDGRDEIDEIFVSQRNHQTDCQRFSNHFTIVFSKLWLLLLLSLYTVLCVIQITFVVLPQSRSMSSSLLFAIKSLSLSPFPSFWACSTIFWVSCSAFSVFLNLSHFYSLIDLSCRFCVNNRLWFRIKDYNINRPKSKILHWFRQFQMYFLPLFLLLNIQMQEFMCWFTL